MRVRYQASHPIGLICERDTTSQTFIVPWMAMSRECAAGRVSQRVEGKLEETLRIGLWALPRAKLIPDSKVPGSDCTGPVGMDDDLAY